MSAFITCPACQQINRLDDVRLVQDCARCGAALPLREVVLLPAGPALAADAQLLSSGAVSIAEVRSQRQLPPTPPHLWWYCHPTEQLRRYFYGACSFTAPQGLTPEELVPLVAQALQVAPVQVRAAHAGGPSSPWATW